MLDLKGFTETDKILYQQFQTQKYYGGVITAEMRLAYNKYMRLYRKSTPMRYALSIDNSANWKMNNAEANAKTKLEWARNNKDKVNESTKRWLLKNPDYQKGYYRANRDALLEKAKQKRRNKRLSRQ